MKLSQSRRGFLLAVLAGACLLPSVSSAANVIVGSGSDTSYLVLQSPNLGLRTYEIHYTYSSGTAQDGYFLLSQVLASESSLIANVPGGSNRFLDSITLNSVKEAFDGTNYWAQWVSGGQSGFPSASPIPSGTWSFGSGMSAPYRLIVPGSWDAFYFSDGNSAPAISPVPETSSALLGLVGVLVILRRRRNG